MLLLLFRNNTVTLIEIIEGIMKVLKGDLKKISEDFNGLFINLFAY